MSNFKALKLAAKIFVPIGVVRIVLGAVSTNVFTKGTIDKIVVGAGTVALAIVAGVVIDEKMAETIDLFEEWWNEKPNNQQNPEVQ